MNYTYGRYRSTKEDYVSHVFTKGDLVESILDKKRGVVLEITLEEADTCEIHEWVRILWYDNGKKQSYQDNQYRFIKNLSKKSE